VKTTGAKDQQQEELVVEDFFFGVLVIRCWFFFIFEGMHGSSSPDSVGREQRFNRDAWSA